ncbi:MAG: hypothetical protein ACOVSW_21575 [Candidatus Kapaibacteriota bacterium]|jgi:hypothetical protein
MKFSYTLCEHISEVYDAKATNKQAALREIMSMKDATAFLQASGYNP